MRPILFGTRGSGISAIVALALSLTCVTAWAGEVNLVANGGFETPDGGSTYRVFSTGNTLEGWTIEQGTVETVASTYWQTADGKQSLDLNGIFEQIGTISQDIATKPGQQYRIRFALAGNPEGDPVIKSLKLSWDGKELEELRFDTTGHTNTNMGWEYHEYIVGASSATSRLRFQSTSSDFYGPALDDISVVPLDQFESSALPRVAPLRIDHSARPYAATATTPGNLTSAPSMPASTSASTATSLPLVETELAVGFYPCLTIKGNVGRTYRIEYADSVNAAEWLTTTNFVLPSSPFIWIDTSGNNASHRFYRAVMTP